jgi:hypothetical protein
MISVLSKHRLRLSKQVGQNWAQPPSSSQRPVITRPIKSLLVNCGARLLLWSGLSQGLSVRDIEFLVLRVRCFGFFSLVDIGLDRVPETRTTAGQKS